MAGDLIGMLANPAWLAAFGVAIIVPLFGFLGTLLAHRPPPAPPPRKPDLVSLPEHPLLLSATAKLCAEDRAVLDAILSRVSAFDAAHEATHVRLLKTLERLEDRLDRLPPN